MRQVLVFVVLLLANACSANDSIGYLGAGGIEFKKTADISMEMEVLTISRNLVRVEYEFLNTSSTPIKETIIFPMPFYGFDEGCSPEHSGQLEGFKLWVDGVRQGTTRTVRARLHGTDVTNRLRELGFSDQDIAEYRGVEGYCYSSDTPPPKGIFAKNLATLDKGGLAKVVKEDGSTWVTPLWEAAYFYSWEQVFPPNIKVRVAHEYVPFQGSQSGWYDFTKAGELKRIYKELLEKFCMTDGTIRAGEKIQKQLSTGKVPVGGLVAGEVSYILTTGANWAGPIKSFTLNLQKASKNELVSLCLDGNFRKQDELTISMHETNYIPKKDVTAIFLYWPPDTSPVSSEQGETGYKPGYRLKKHQPMMSQ